MSGYGKQPRLSHGFDTSRSYSEPYSEASSFGLQPSVPSIQQEAFQNGPLIAAMEYTGQSRIAYDDQAGPYLNVGSTPIPQVTTFRPSRGSKGTRMDVYISSLYELATSNIPSFFLMFASQKCPATLSKIDQQGGVCQYIVSAAVPTFALTGWQSRQVPVCLLIETNEGELVSRVDVGAFKYLDENKQETASTQEVSRKRKISLESTDLLKSPAKRASNHQLRPKEEYGSYGYTGSEELSYPQYLQPSNQYSAVPQYDRTIGSYQSHQSQRAIQQYQYTNSSNSSTPNVKAQSPQVSTWSPYSAMSTRVTQSPALVAAVPTTRPVPPSLSSPLPANPPLIRTSTLQQTPSPATTPAGAQQSNQVFNPYMHYPHKAVLKIVGDLDSMTESWSVDEWAASRRIVMFKRSQSGCTITTTFGPITVEERPPNSICVSCIFWEDKSECFVTSVDTIYLLEQLIGARFTVEEKNRIRRNLEGFRPLTVSKAKPDSEDFFKLIMGFPNPKPRNIEKDVKVFPWKILVHALKKIIGKYSASPSSTLPPPLLTPASSTGYATEGSSIPSHASIDLNNAVSPRSVSRSISGASASTAMMSSGTTKGFSPPSLKQNMNLSSGGPPDLRFPVPNYLPKNEQSHQWQGSQHYMPRLQYQQLGGGYQSSRSSYDLSNYLDTSPATAPASAAAGQGRRQSSGYSSHGLPDGSGLSTSEVHTRVGDTQRSTSQQMPTS